MSSNSGKERKENGLCKRIAQGFDKTREVAHAASLFFIPYSRNLHFYAVWAVKNMHFYAVWTLFFVHFFAVWDFFVTLHPQTRQKNALFCSYRHGTGLFKHSKRPTWGAEASEKLHCDNLTLIMMYGDKKDIVEDGKTVHCVLATDWLLHNTCQQAR